MKCHPSFFVTTLSLPSSLSPLIFFCSHGSLVSSLQSCASFLLSSPLFSFLLTLSDHDAPSLHPVRCCWLRIWLYLPPSRGFQAEVTARLMDSRGHRQVAGGPASEQPTQRCQSAGQTPAASPLVGRQGSTLGSGPVRPALRLTRLSSHRHSPDGLTSSQTDSKTPIGSTATHSSWFYVSAECPKCALG